MTTSSITIVIPIHKNIPIVQLTIQTLIEHEHSKMFKEIFVCHNGPDKKATIEAMKLQSIDSKIKTFHTDIPGLGAGCKLGIEAATGDYILITGSDLPFGFSDLNEWINLLKNGNMKDIVIGSKLHPKTVIKGRKVTRKFATLIFSLIKKIIIPFNLPADTQGTIFIKTSLAKHHSRSSFSQSFFYTTELIAKAIKEGASFCEVPVYYAALENKSSVSIFRESFNFIKSLLILRKVLIGKKL